MTRNYLDILAETIRNNWNQPALTDFFLTEDGTAQDTTRGKAYTYGEMYTEIVRVAVLLTHLGLQPGDHIAICGSNSSHWVIAYLAIAKMQGVSVTVMHTLQPDQIARMIAFSDAKVLFTNVDLWDELKDQSLPQVEHVISLEDWNVLYEENQTINLKGEILNQDCHFPTAEPDNLAMICFTSGSSGMPKGVMLSYRSITNNVNQAFLLYPIEDNSQFLSILPFAHMAGMIGDMLSQLSFGKKINVLRESLSIRKINDAIKIIAPYMFVSIPAIFEINGIDILSALSPKCKLIFMGGAKLSTKSEQRIMNSLIPLSLIYGQTETGASISISPYKKHRLTSSGKIVEGMTARIAENGEILVKGENVMLGYYKDPEATARKIDADGWLHTGDRGHLDEEGYLYVEGRLEHDMIVLPNGENIHPEDIENKINAMPEVAESIVVARNGQLTAIVRPENPENPEHLKQLRLTILRTINPQLPLYSQLYDICFSDKPLARTEKQTLKRYLYQ